MTEPRPLSLLDCFAAFYAEVAREKLASDPRTLPADADPAGRARAARDRLYRFLDLPLQLVRSRGTVAEIDTYRFLRMVMAAVADEAFLLDLDWRGKLAWLAVTLEGRLFDSRRAGTHFFAYAERLQQADGRSVPARDAAAVLLLALRLGFQGRYRGPLGQDILNDYRHKLYRLTHDAPARDDEPLFAQAYRHCVILPERHNGGRATVLLRDGLLVVAGYLLLSALLWLWIVSPYLSPAGMPAAS
jgi:type VI secretion system protein ImpK